MSKPTVFNYQDYVNLKGTITTYMTATVSSNGKC